MALDGLTPPAPPKDRLAALLVLPLTLLLVAVVGVFWVAYRTARVDGDSMRPGLAHGDRLLVTKSYGAPHRGDVVLIVLEERAEPTEVVKRVVGVPGDVVAVRDGVVTVNGAAESYAFPVTFVAMRSSYSWGPHTVPQGTVFVMGDNRPISLDSRYVGPAPLESVLGRVIAVFAPVDRIRSVSGGP